jgi:hypothetical protein
MKVSEMIAELTAYLDANGDHEVVDSYGESLTGPEEVEGDCVLADKA